VPDFGGNVMAETNIPELSYGQERFIATITYSFVGGEMPNDKQPRGKIIIPGPSTEAKPEPPPLPRGKPMRTLDELRPFARQVASNIELLRKLKKAMGSGDESRAREMVDEVRHFAQTLDPTITYAEGAEVALLLMEISLDQGGESND
jgi:hypothetical protein